MPYGPSWPINVCHLIARNCVEPQLKDPAVQFYIHTERKAIHLLVRDNISQLSPI